MVRTLVLSSQPVVDGSVFASILRGGLADLGSVSFATQSRKLPKGTLPLATYGVAFSFAEGSEVHTAEFLADVLATLVPGGTVTICEKGHEDTAALERQLLLAGFVGCKSTVSPTGDALVEAQKPAWQTGSKAAITLKSKANATGPKNTAAAVQLKKTWNVGADDGEELIDEDELLTEEDRLRPTAPAAECGVKATKKACKDCTCGRAEGQMEKVELTPELLENPQSGCGSCGLGDAFRCATCPYRGLPTFEKGKKIELPNDFLTADA